MGALASNRTPPLTSIQNVSIEMSKVYRRTKRGEINSADGYRMVMMLAALKQCLESREFERRLTEMEAAINKTGSDVVRFIPKVV
jgi:hypothetical protein